MENRLKDDELKNVIGGTGETEEDECPGSPDGKHHFGNEIFFVGCFKNFRCKYCESFMPIEHSWDVGVYVEPEIIQNK